MALRVDPNLAPDLLNAIEVSLSQQNTAIQQLSSGRSVNAPSDNPAATAALILNQTQAGQNDTFQRNIDSLQGMFQTADSTLSSAVELMTKAISLGTEGANGTLTASDRQAIADQLQGIQNEMVGLANTSYQGEYLFSGTAVNIVPYANVAGFITYQGNTNTNSLEILNGQTMQLNLPGSQIFSNPSGDVFGSLQQLITALQTGTGIDAANTAVQNAFQELNQQRVFYGNGLNQMSSATTFLNRENVQLSQQQNNLIAVDPAKAATNLSQAEMQNQAVLAATGKVLNNPNLFSYLA
ncbi:MAG: flagellar hook-associated protein FlgL [Acidobacteriota bacterium]|nr:flagellar hook-associated protein FlgL [Acidobacteriota bacterium]